RAVHACVIGEGPKNGYAAVGGAMGLEALKERLAIVQGGEGGRKRHGTEGHNARVVPLAIVPIGDEHVVAVVRAKGRFLAEFFREAGVRGARDGDGGGHDGDECTRESRRREDTNWQGLEKPGKGEEGRSHRVHRDRSTENTEKRKPKTQVRNQTWSTRRTENV